MALAVHLRLAPTDKKLPFVILADKDAEADDLENAQARRHFYRKATAEERAAIPIPRYTIVPTVRHTAGVGASS